MTGAIQLEAAQQRVLERVRPVAAERVPVERAAGRVLAEDAVALLDLPPFTSSAMDGFAVRGADLSAGASLALVGEAAAGSPSTRAVGPGEAVAISTGGVVPAGADTVVPVERARVDGDRVIVVDPPVEGANVRALAGDIARGGVVAAAGATLGAVHVGALAAAGVGEVQCRKRPRVGIVVTGSELRPPGTELGPGEIYESNGLMLSALLTSAGAVPAHQGVVADDAGELERALERSLLGFDMVITSGGASVGQHDLVRRVQAGLRVEEVFWGVAIRPGRPVAFGMRRDHPVFNLPGNPVSALVCFELLVRPAIGALLGAAQPLPRLAVARLGSPARRQPDRDDFVRATVLTDGDAVEVRPLARQESHMIALAAGAAALVHVPRGEGELSEGTVVRYLPLV